MTDRTPEENRQAKADAIAIAMIRRGIRSLAEIKPLPYTSRRHIPTRTRFATTALREAAEWPAYRAVWGDPPHNAPNSEDSPTWLLIAATYARISAIPAGDPEHVPADLTHDRPTWTGATMPARDDS